MYLNINSECKYTHIYFISNIPREFFFGTVGSGMV